MTIKQRTQIEKILNNGEVAVDTRSNQVGQDSQGFPIFEILFIEPPKNYKIIKFIEPYNGAVLLDLDYVEPRA